jgi:hypothetical protein
LTSKALIFSKEFAAGDAKKSQWATFLRKANLSGISGEFPTIREGIREFFFSPSPRPAETSSDLKKEQVFIPESMHFRRIPLHDILRTC